MKTTLLSIVLLMALALPVAAGEFIVTVNGVAKEIDLDEETVLVLPDGAKLTLRLHQKEYLAFETEMIGFEYPSRYKPSRSDLGDGVFQTMLVTSVGTGFIVQEYTAMNPEPLIDLMLKEMTKEEVEYGYTYSESPVERQAGGLRLKGKQAVTKYPGHEWTRSVLSYGSRDSGILIITFIEKDQYASESDLIERLLGSLKIKPATR